MPLPIPGHIYITGKANLRNKTLLPANENTSIFDVDLFGLDTFHESHIISAQCLRTSTPGQEEQNGLYNISGKVLPPLITIYDMTLIVSKIVGFRRAHISNLPYSDSHLILHANRDFELSGDITDVSIVYTYFFTHATHPYPLSDECLLSIA